MPSAPPTRIMFLVPPAEGGMAEHVLSLLRHLDKMQFQPSLVCSPRGDLAAEARTLGGAVHTIPIVSMLNPAKILRAALQVAARIRVEQPQIVHAHSWSAGFAALLALRTIRKKPALVFTLHSFPPALGGLSQRAVRMITNAADAIICVSQALARIVDDSAQHKVRIIPNGIEPSTVFLSQAAARKELGLPQDVLLVGAVARLAPQKGVHVLVEAAALLPDTQFAVIGDGPLMSELQGKVKQLHLQDHFFLLGQVSDAQRFLKAFDVMAIPSFSEGAPIVTLEAMLAERAIVASRLDALDEIIREGETGILAPVGDAKAFADLLRKVLGDPALREHMGKAGRARVEGCYTIQHMLECTTQLYREVQGSRFKVQS